MTNATAPPVAQIIPSYSVRNLRADLVTRLRVHAARRGVHISTVVNEALDLGLLVLEQAWAPTLDAEAPRR